MLISPAFAQAAGGSQGDIFSFLLPIALMFGVFWLLVFRPQQKKIKQHKEMIANLKRGDQVLTGGGLYGRVAKIEGGNICHVEIAPNVKVKVAQSTISEVIAKPEPQTVVEADTKDKDDAEKSS